MGKKSKSPHRAAKANERKDTSVLGPPPPPAQKEIGSAKLLSEPSKEGGSFKVIGEEGYDDGGVADLSLLIDLEDKVQRRRRGDKEYLNAVKNNALPRDTTGAYSHLVRRDQKIRLAQLLFSEADGTEDKGPSEVYVDQVDGQEDKATIKLRQERLEEAKNALRLSLLLREPACTSLSLAEICKRRLTLYGKEGAPDALRCVDKSVEVAGNDFWDSDDVAIEGQEEPVVPNPKYEKDPTTPALANPASLKLISKRVSHLCLRSALLQRGNALAALGREDEARFSYERVFPLLENEPRCARVDWERHSLHVNIGNTMSRQGDYEQAEEHYKISEDLARDHLNEPGGSTYDGRGMLIVTLRARAFALKKAGSDEEAKELMKEVIKLQMEHNIEAAKKKKEEAEKDKAAFAQNPEIFERLERLEQDVPAAGEK